MTVKELIEKLKTFPSDAEVSMETKEYRGKATDVNYEFGALENKVYAVITDYE